MALNNADHASEATLESEMGDAYMGVQPDLKEQTDLLQLAQATYGNTVDQDSGFTYTDPSQSCYQAPNAVVSVHPTSTADTSSNGFIYQDPTLPQIPNEGFDEFSNGIPYQPQLAQFITQASQLPKQPSQSPHPVQQSYPTNANSNFRVPSSVSGLRWPGVSFLSPAQSGCYILPDFTQPGSQPWLKETENPIHLDDQQSNQPTSHAFNPPDQAPSTPKQTYDVGQPSNTSGHTLNAVNQPPGNSNQTLTADGQLGDGTDPNLSVVYPLFRYIGKQTAPDEKPYHQDVNISGNKMVDSNRKKWSSDKISACYSNLRSNVMPSWGKHDEFVYIQSSGKLEPRSFNANELYWYVHCNPRNLRLLVGRYPANSNVRFENTPEKCRWVACPVKTKTIQNGEFRVAFQEFLPEVASGIHNPYRVAGSMHLFCFERLFDPVEYHRRGVLLPDNFNYTRETLHPMSLDHVSQGFVNEVYLPWFSRDKAHPPRAYPDTLCHALVTGQLSKAPPIRSAARSQRLAKKAAGKPAYHVAMHKGDLARYIFTRYGGEAGIEPAYLTWLRCQDLPMPTVLTQDDNEDLKPKQNATTSDATSGRPPPSTAAEDGFHLQQGAAPVAPKQPAPIQTNAGNMPLPANDHGNVSLPRSSSLRGLGLGLGLGLVETSNDDAENEELQISANPLQTTAHNLGGANLTPALELQDDSIDALEMCGNDTGELNVPGFDPGAEFDQIEQAGKDSLDTRPGEASSWGDNMVFDNVYGMMPYLDNDQVDFNLQGSYQDELVGSFPEVPNDPVQISNHLQRVPEENFPTVIPDPAEALAQLGNEQNRRAETDDGWTWSTDPTSGQRYRFDFFAGVMECESPQVPESLDNSHPSNNPPNSHPFIEAGDSTIQASASGPKSRDTELSPSNNPSQEKRKHDEISDEDEGLWGSASEVELDDEPTAKKPRLE